MSLAYSSGASHRGVTFRPDGNRTAVTWSMFGQNNFMAKTLHLS
jgi:hypothetical protein